MYPLTGTICMKMQERLGKCGYIIMQRVTITSTRCHTRTTLVTVHFLLFEGYIGEYLQQVTVNIFKKTINIFLWICW